MTYYCLLEREAWLGGRGGGGAYHGGGGGGPATRRRGTIYVHDMFFFMHIFVCSFRCL